jgi:hypothetical protein
MNLTSHKSEVVHCRYAIVSSEDLRATQSAALGKTEYGGMTRVRNLLDRATEQPPDFGSRRSIRQSHAVVRIQLRNSSHTAPHPPSLASEFCASFGGMASRDTDEVRSSTDGAKVDESR